MSKTNTEDVEQALAQEKANQEQIGATVQAAKASATQPKPTKVEVALKALIDAYIDTRGCSRLVAAGYAAKAAKDEHEAISKRVSS